MLMVTGFGAEWGVLSGHALCRSFWQSYLPPQVLIYTLHILNLPSCWAVSGSHMHMDLFLSRLIFCQEAANTINHTYKKYINMLLTLSFSVSLSLPSTPLCFLRVSLAFHCHLAGWDIHISLPLLLSNNFCSCKLKWRGFFFHKNCFMALGIF